MGALAVVPRLPAPVDQPEGFQLHGLRVFNRIPAHHHGVVVLRGAVVVYETDSLCREPIQEGGFYVVERQNPRAGRSWTAWLKDELCDADGRGGPRSRLSTSREVIQAVRLVRHGHDPKWWYRLPSGFHDGPLQDWAVGLDFIGKVVGLYIPEAKQVVS